jgi:hypothetical protein
VVLVLDAPGGGEDAVAISPIKGQHATFLVRHGIAEHSWQKVLSMNKSEAVESGADRLIFKHRPDDGLDEYDTMSTKIVELLRRRSSTEVEIDKHSETWQQSMSPIGDKNVNSKPAFVQVTHDIPHMPNCVARESAPPIARVAETAEQLRDLFLYNYRHWRPVAFALFLVQEFSHDNALVVDDHGPCVVPVDFRVASTEELSQLVRLVSRDAEARARDLARFLVSAPFVRLFDPNANDPSPDDIAAASKYVVEFFKANLLLAKRVRTTESPRRFRRTIDNTSHLVDRNLEGVDQFVKDYVDGVHALPEMGRNILHDSASHIVPLTLHQDTQLLKRILRKLKMLEWMDKLWPR